MTFNSRVITSLASAALLCSLTPSQAAAGAPAAQVLASSYLADSDGYSMAAPQAVAAEDKMNARIEARVATNCSNAWQVFTDFDAMPRFLPGMEVSKIVSREGGHVTVMQRGRHQFGIFSKHYQSERELTMSEPALIESRSLPGQTEHETLVDQPSKNTKVTANPSSRRSRVARRRRPPCLRRPCLPPTW